MYYEKNLVRKKIKMLNFFLYIEMVNFFVVIIMKNIMKNEWLGLIVKIENLMRRWEFYRFDSCISACHS
ncbi:hypothetical protein X966_03240 [Borrelia parkeri HR1]|nr:hypothetical protein X966_03240 [Borrelia parkeri HR1]